VNALEVIKESTSAELPDILSQEEAEVYCRAQQSCRTLDDLQTEFNSFRLVLTVSYSNIRHIPQRADSTEVKAHVTTFAVKMKKR
jgi:hypothetical protein